MCSPVQLEVAKPTAKPEAKPEIKPEPAVAVRDDSSTPAATPTPAAATYNPAATVAPPVRRSVSGPPTQSPVTKPALPTTNPAMPVQQQIRPPPIQQSTPLPQPRGGEQSIDNRYGQFVCRTGEVVWFYRPKTSAWGLGLVVRRWVGKDGTGSKTYLVQPLSHPFDAPTPEAVTADEHLKPWLAWSAPQCTFTYLQQHPQLRYDQVDWHALLSGQYGQGIADVDASILAAKAIDTTYTLFERLKTSPGPSWEERHYNGIYLGAEKIWRGDPVRIRIGPGGLDLMVVTAIVERVSTNGTPKAPPSSQVWLHGDIYSYATIPAPDPSNPPANPSDSNSNIPIRMREDIAWRNRLLIPLNQSLAYWRLIQSNHRIEMADIKGRWYETSLLFEESFTKAVKNNEGGNGIWMNARGDATGIGRNPGVLRPERLAAFGTALPKGTQLVEGLDSPAPAPTQPRTQQHEMHGIEMGVGTAGAGGVSVGAEAFSLDDFMNVDHLDDSNVDFGNDFTF